MKESELTGKLHRLESTGDHAERDMLALDLAETADPRVFTALVRLIGRPELENHRGTLVYCLENYDCSSLLHMLVDLVVTGNFEVAAQATMILHDTKFPANASSEATKRLCEIRGVQGQQEWRRDMLDGALAALAC